MQELRKSASKIDPAYEDEGLFKSELSQITVELVPQFARNGRGDMRVRGFVNLKSEIEVLFAGRRVKHVAALEARLKDLLRHARKDAASKDRAIEIDQVRLPVRVEGVWRQRFSRDQTGWETGSYHLVAARWSIVDRTGNSVSYGAAPIR